MWIVYTHDGRREKVAAFQRNLTFIWVHASEGDDIEIIEYIDAPTQVQLNGREVAA